MLVIPKIEFRRKPKKTRPAPAALTLLSAAYDAGGLFVLLSFDRAVSVADIDVGQFQLFDGQANLKRYLGSGVPTLDDPETVHLGLVEMATITAGNVSLTVGNENGIVGVDGGMWEGITDVALPFPP